MTARAVALDNLRALSGEELVAHLREQRGQLFQVRLQQTIGQVENHRQIRAIRKEIARTMTVQIEGRLAAERGEPAPAPRPAAKAKAKAKARPVAAAAAKPARRTRKAAPAADTAAAEPATEAQSTDATAEADEEAT
jgi:ribosomal protein L29